MPFTPYHFGPNGIVGLVFRRWIDVPVFILANVVIDLEPLFVMFFGVNCRLHGYLHTLIIGGIVGFIWGVVAWFGRDIFKVLMKFFRIPYQTNFRKMAISGVLGAWLHILFDSFIYTDIKPLWPSEFNPVYELLSSREVYTICKVSIALAVIYYVIILLSIRRKRGK